MDNSFALKYKQKIAWFLRGIWDKYRLMIFQNSPNITRRFAARDILVNFEISLAVFIPNTPRNHAISYTYLFSYNLTTAEHMASLCHSLWVYPSTIWL